MMYRLLKIPSSGINNSKINSRPSPQLSCKFCVLCGISTNFTSNTHRLKLQAASSLLCTTRQQGTNTHTNLVSEIQKRKRYLRDKKYFTDLLEVFSNATNETKATVRNLKPRDVSRIVNNPNVGLDHLHCIKDKKIKSKIISNTKCALEVLTPQNDATHSTSQEIERVFEKSSDNESNVRIDSLPQSELLTEPIEVFKLQEESIFDSELADIEIEHSTKDSLSLLPDNFTEENDSMKSLETQDLVSTHRRKRHAWKQVTKEKLAKEKISDLEKMCKEKAFNTTLYSYLSLCVGCNFLQRGLATLNHYINRSKVSPKHSKVTDPKVFEVLMRGFASKGNYSKVHELWDMMTSAELNPTIDMFASRIESAACSVNHKDKVPLIISSMKNWGFELKNIFSDCHFLGNQRHVILQAIQEVHPNFEPFVPAPSICYSCSLLQEINDKGTNLNLKSPAEGVIQMEDIEMFAEEQLKSEASLYLPVKTIETKIEPEDVLKANRAKLNLMRESWHKDLKKGLERDITILQLLKKSPSLNLFPYLQVLDTNAYVDIMMKEVQRLAEGSETFSPQTYQLYRHLGNQVRNRYVLKYKKTHGILDKTKSLYKNYCRWYLNPLENGKRSNNGRQEWQQIIHEHQSGPSIICPEEYWPSTVLLSLGKFLYNIIISDVNIDVNILSSKSNKPHFLPAFYRVYRQQGYKSVEEIKPHPVISKLFRAAAEEHILFDISQVPMLSPPLPWISHKSGGYLLTKTDLIRLPDQALQQRKRLKEAHAEQLYPPLDSLNQLGSIPWKINKPVLDTVIEVFNSGGNDRMDIPSPPHISPVAEPVNPSMSKQEKYQAYRQRMILRRQKAENYSLWCDALYKLSLANHFRDKIFWLPHNMDFRGRVYPCPPHLNHLGADMPRSLLYFAQGKPLGPDGLDWLKIHLVNLLGTKKHNSVQERLEYANSVLPDILDSAEKPLLGRKWWMDSETPWQTLACCMEIYAALQHQDGPELYVSHFPIHQDGSCNGLQHYAALGRDQAGAASVNLMPQDLPQDVYSCVATIVERERAKDSLAGVKLAKELDGFVRRKVIKQTVMTTVYGVTRFGARLQIAKQLKDIDSFPKESVWPASTYLVVKTFESLREMFNSTKEIQDWFTECARLVSQICGENMEYVTPLGLPVVQYYSRPSKQPEFRTTKYGRLQEYFPIDMFERPNVMKQKNAFPPNFIHSLDSSHMMLTSIFSEQKGITFVSVHDCYWTHASTVPVMNQICREQFVALHSQPILENLSDFMLNRYCYTKSELEDKDDVSRAKQRVKAVLAQVPPKGSFVLENVLDSVYFFS